MTFPLLLFFENSGEHMVSLPAATELKVAATELKVA